MFVDNALYEETVKIVATGCQLLINEIQINMFFFVYITVTLLDR